MLIFSMNFKNTTLVCIATLATAGPIIKHNKHIDPDSHPETVFPLVKNTVKVYGDIQFNQFSNNQKPICRLATAELVTTRNS